MSGCIQFSSNVYLDISFGAVSVYPYNLSLRKPLNPHFSKKGGEKCRGKLSLKDAI